MMGPEEETLFEKTRTAGVVFIMFGCIFGTPVMMIYALVRCFG